MKTTIGEPIVTITIKGQKVVIYDDGEYDVPYHAYLVVNGNRKHLDDYDSITQCFENMYYGLMNGYIK